MLAGYGKDPMLKSSELVYGEVDELGRAVPPVKNIARYHQRTTVLGTELPDLLDGVGHGGVPVPFRGAHRRGAVGKVNVRADHG